MQTITKFYFVLTIIPKLISGTNLCELAPWSLDCMSPEDVIVTETSTVRATYDNEKPYEMTTVSQDHLKINQGTLHTLRATFN